MIRHVLMVLSAFGAAVLLALTSATPASADTTAELCVRGGGTVKDLSGVLKICVGGSLDGEVVVG